MGGCGAGEVASSFESGDKPSVSFRSGEFRDGMRNH